MCSEVEVIHVWLTELLRTVENADDVLVKNFSFGPLEKRLKTGDYLRGETIRESLAVLRQVEVELEVGGNLKQLSLILKVLPTDDEERYLTPHKFQQLLRFSKEVQVYLTIVEPMMR